MPQETNLNVAPYFDDFDANKNYYKVLFKPGYPVQARELTSLQSILQNQVENFGNHFFKEGDKVIPGQLTYLNNFYSVEIESSFLGIPVSEYLDQLIGKKITGQSSGIVAKVVDYISDVQSERGNYTLYVDYLETSSSNLSSREFNDNEVLITEENLSFLNTFISAGEGFASTISTNSTSIGSGFALSEGVYFLRGYFVQIADQILILDQYTNTPSYRIGLSITENIISSELDSSLTDNAQGFNNYASPGADRLKITATLAKKALDDFSDQNFIQLATVVNGVLRETKKSPEYNRITDELARRTFDESGHYYVKEFLVSVKESLNDGFGNRGIYDINQKTSSGNIPSDDLAIYKISPGKAYVRGYEVETRGTSFIDIPKPRTTKLVENQAVNFAFGPSVIVNRVYGSPSIGFNTSGTISLRDSRIGITSSSSSGKEIGVSRVYDFFLESGSYNTSNLSTNQWNLSLFDAQFYNDIIVNEPVTLNLPTQIKGQSSGATAYLKYAVSSGTGITAYQTIGEFFVGENLIFNGIDDNSRVSTSVTSYGISDVKSVYGTVGSSGTFVADLIQYPSRVIGISSISAEFSGISTITTPQLTFPGIVTSGNLIRYSRPGFSSPSFAKVESVFTNSITISGVTTVTGVCDGALPQSPLETTDLTILKSQLESNFGNGNFAGNYTLYSILPKKNIESVDLSNSSSLTIRKQFDTISITNGSTNQISAGTNEVFLPFDEERYTLIRSNGTIEPLSSDKFELTVGSTQLKINGLGSNDTGCTLIATLRKNNIKSKIKQKELVTNLVIDKSKYSYSGIGQSTSNDGLIYGNYPYGTRVQDESICLNVPDAIKIYGIFESQNTNIPEAPSMTIGSMDGSTSTTNDLIIGDELIGSVSGARALYVVRKSDSSINFIYKNSLSFENGEIVSFTQSGVKGIVISVNIGSKNITKNYKFSNGQRSGFYDYSRINRIEEYPEPKGKIIVYFSKGYYDLSDNGDITTVGSYNSFNYTTDISKVDGIRNTDLIDLRPRVSNYSVSEGARSPFEFDGRTFDGGINGQHSSKNVIASNESISLSYNYYLPRVDRIYLDKEGIFTVKFGTPADIPQLPDEVSGALNIANIYLPAYLYSSTNAKVEFVDHKRYQMNDISKLERRIKNLEFYTTLSLLENSTLNLFVSDKNGLNRFKSGIFVDNFGTIGTQDVTVGVKNSIDIKKGVLRPSHYTTSVNLEIGSNSISGIGTTTNTNQDKRFAEILGTNIKRSNSVISLDYSDVSWLRQPFATRSESVTPFLVRVWEGSIQFEPSVDVWIDVRQQQIRDVLQEGSFLGVAEAMKATVTTQADGSRIGVSPVIWNSWETTSVSVSSNISESQSQSTTSADRQGTFSEGIDALGVYAVNNWTNGVPSTFLVEEEVTETETTIDASVEVNLSQRRSGTQSTVNEQIDTESLGERITSRNIINFMRSRNIEFTARRMKPFTQVYPFFDNVDVKDFCMSKLLEIQMTTGTFQVGETVKGVMPSLRTTQNVSPAATAIIEFRVATPNHKYGPYNSPTDIFERNPYDRNNTIQSSYSSTSTILNIDTFSLSDESQSSFSGFVRTGMILEGQSSGAQATVTDVRLVTDRLGTLIGSFLVPDSTNNANPVFETGRTRFRLTSSSINSRVPGVVTTSAEDIFYSQGDIDNTQEVTLSLRNARVQHTDSTDTRTLSDSSSSSTTFTSDTNSRLTGVYRDPLAQSFVVDDTTGIFVTKVDLYFQTKDDTLPVTLQIREVELGTPSQKILAYSEVELSPDKVNLSEDASVATTFEFESPVYLEGQREYALVVISNSTEYRVWISRLGESDVSTLGTEQGQILVSTQRLLGSLFKSQNASTWTPSQYEDLTFEIYRADFVPSGSVQFFNPNQSQSLERLSENALTIIPNNIRIGIGTTVNDSDLTIGNTIIQNGTNASGILVGYGGTSTGNLTITNSGIGYTPSTGSYTYTGVALTSVIGNGLNATANITIQNGIAVGATILNGGSGYTIGDLLSPIQIGGNTLGSGMRLSVNEITGQNQLIVENVQGEFSTGASNYIKYINNSGVTTDLNYGVGGNVLVVSPITTISDGNHIKVFHRNHGMHSNVNKVIISEVESDIAPTTLSATYDASSTGSISVASTANFTTFENVSVASTNPGYILIGNEIISYTGFSGNTLTGIVREIDNTSKFTYSSGDLIYKYEFGGVSLRRINKTHTLSDVTIQNPIGLDFYHIKVDMSSNGIDRSTSSSLPKLHFIKEKMGGGLNARSSYNIPFEIVTPNVRITNPTGTTIIPSVRTTSGSSIDGNESSFVDKGFQQISLSHKNYFESPRIIASEINESNYLSSLPGNKSFALNMNLLSDDSRLSPTVDLDNVSMIFTTNRINNPVTNYSNDFRVNSTKNDPNSFFYTSKNIILENPATSLQIILDAYVSNYSDIRAFYSVDQNLSINETIFVPFPGYLNLDSNKNIINPANNSGLPDSNIPKVDSYQYDPGASNYKEYKFTIDNLTSFNSFRIKLIGSSINQAFPPIIRNLRVIALA